MTTITKNQIKKYVQLGYASPYNPEIKDQYKKLGRKILRYIAKKMNLTNYNIRYNPAGIAMAGDHTLHNENFYLTLNTDCQSTWFMYRSCKGLTDYTGGSNQIMAWSKLIDMGMDAFIDRLNSQFKK